MFIDMVKICLHIWVQKSLLLLMLISFPHIFIGRVTKKSTEDKGLYNFDRCLFYLYCTNTGSALRLLWDTLLFALTAYFN